MLNIYLTDAEGKLNLEQEITHNNLIHMVNPSTDEINELSTRLNIPTAYFCDALDQNERPRIEKSGSVRLMVLNAPRLLDEHAILNQAMYQTCPVGIIHTQDHLIVVSAVDLPVLSNLIAGQYGAFHSYMKTRISLLLFKAIADCYSLHLAQMNKKIAEFQQKLKKSYRNHELFGLISINKSLVYFSTSLSAMKIVYQRLMKGYDMKIYEEEQKRLEDILIEISQAAEITEIRRESLSNLMDAYAAIVNNNLNSVMKMLTTLAIVMVIPTMIGSIFSMNIALPYQDFAMTTVVVSILMLAIVTTLVYVFYKKNYLRI